MEVEELLTIAKEDAHAWNVPLVEYLNTYLSGIRPDMNFVRAGMMLEGTTSVFSNKVKQLLKLAYGTETEEKVTRKKVEREWVCEGKLIDFDLDLGESTDFLWDVPRAHVATKKATSCIVHFPSSCLQRPPDEFGAIVLSGATRKSPEAASRVESQPDMPVNDGSEFELDEEEHFPMLDPDEEHPEMVVPFQKMTSMRVPKSFKREKTEHDMKMPFLVKILRSVMIGDKSVIRDTGSWQASQDQGEAFEDVELPPPPIDEENIPIRRDADYEGMCLSSVQTMIDDGRQRVAFAERTERLVEWESEMSCLFSRTKEEFDIGKVKEQTITMISSGINSFRELKRHLQDYQVSRAFLSLLVLANEGKILLGDEFDGDFTITLPQCELI